MNTRTFILTLAALIFTLTSSASAAMLGCWSMNNQASTMSGMPCQVADNTDDSSGSLFDYCDDMSLCKTPVADNSKSAILDITLATDTRIPASMELVTLRSTGPPTPPPKQLL